MSRRMRRIHESHQRLEAASAIVMMIVFLVGALALMEISLR